ncbi:MAG: hypothetical protein VKO21_06730 [Candidatus Sericytochromatia bacterium]|nr:hypothetical protein [Candidatus Sericytochromatia bacterium]
MKLHILLALCGLALGGCVIQTTGTMTRATTPVQADPTDAWEDRSGRVPRWLELGPGVPYEAVAMTPSGRGWLVGKVQASTGKAVLRATEDGGVTWAQQDRGRLDLLAVAALGEASAVAVGREGVVFRTDDGGERWTLQDSGTDKDLVAVGFADMSRGFALTREGLLLGTLDGGRTWAEKVETNADALRVLPEGQALLHDGQRIMRWGSGGLARLGTLPGVASLHPADPSGDDLWALTTTGRLHRSRDGGWTWQAVSALATQDRWVRQPIALAMDFGPDGRGLILTRTGTLTTLDGGDNWIEGGEWFGGSLRPWVLLLADGSALAGSGTRTLWRIRP